MELPPQIIKHQVRNLAASQDALVMRGGPGLQAAGNRLPVLQAFQEFLEIERRKARRRLIATGMVFLGLLLAVLATASVLYARLAGRVNAEVAKLERALAHARDEAGALRGDGDAMRRALEDAQQAIDALRARVDREADRASPIDLALFASTLDVLRRLQDLHPELSELSRRVDMLAREADALSDLAQAHTERRMRWRAERRAWELAFAEHRAAQVNSQAALSIALKALDPPSGAPDVGRSSSRRRSAVESPPAASPDPGPAWLALESLTQSRFALAPLVAELDRLEREAAAILDARVEAIRRSDAWREAVLEVASGIETWRARCVELQAGYVGLTDAGQ